MFKKILSIVLCLCMLFSTFVVTKDNVVFASTQQESFVYHEDFADEPENTWLAGQVRHESEKVPTGALVNDTALDSQVLEITIGDKANPANANNGDKAVIGMSYDGTVVYPQKYEFSFKFQRVQATNTTGIGVYIPDTDIDGGKGGAAIIGGGNFTTGNWYECRVVIDKSQNPIYSVSVKDITNNGAWTAVTFDSSYDGKGRFLTGDWCSNLLNSGRGPAFVTATLFSHATGDVYRVDDFVFGWGTAVSSVTFDNTSIPESGTVTASFALSNLGGLTSADAIIAGYDKNGQLIAGSSVAKDLSAGSSTITASTESSAELEDDGWIETFLWDSTNNKMINGSYGVIGTPAAVGTTEETETEMVRSTEANTFTVEGTTSASAPITVIAKQGATLLAASHFTADAEGKYSRTFVIDPERCADGTATVTVCVADATAQSFDIPVYSNWDAMITAFKAMDEETEAESFFTIYADNFTYYAPGSDTLSTDLAAITDYEGIAFLKSKRIYDDTMTPVQVVEAALDLVESLDAVGAFETAFAAAKAMPTEAEKIDAIKALITDTSLVTFPVDGVFNIDAVAKALIATPAATLAEIYDAVEDARDEQQATETELAASFTTITGAGELEDFFADPRLGIGLELSDEYWEVLYGVYEDKAYSECEPAEVNPAIEFLCDYIAEYKQFITEIKIANSWESIKYVLNKEYVYISDPEIATSTIFVDSIAAVKEETMVYKRLVGMESSSLAVVKAEFEEAVAAQAALENGIYAEISEQASTDKDTARAFFLQTIDGLDMCVWEMLEVPQEVVYYTDTQFELFAELYNINPPAGANYAEIKSEIQALIAEIAVAETFIANINTSAANDNWSEVKEFYEGEDVDGDGVGDGNGEYAKYIGELSVGVTDRRELYIRIVNIAKETPFAVLSDVKDAFDAAHEAQANWEEYSGAYEGADDTLLDFVSEAWEIYVQANIITISGKVDAEGIQRVTLLIKDGANTPEDDDDTTILLKQIATDEEGKFIFVVGLNPEFPGYEAGIGAGKIRIGGAGINTYAFAPIDLYSDAELDATVEAFREIESNDDVINFFTNYGPMLDMDLNVDNENTYSDLVSRAEAFLFAYNKTKTAGQYADFEDNYDIINGIGEGPAATDIIEEMKAMIACLDALTDAANEPFGDGVGRWALIKTEVEKAINNKWISTTGKKGTVKNEDEMYIRMAGKAGQEKIYKYMTTPTSGDADVTMVDAEYIAAYNAQAKADSAGGGGGGAGGGGGGGTGSVSVDDKVINSGLTDGTSAVTNPANHPAAPFTDITAEFSWAQGSIDALRKYGLIKGDGDGKFRPEAGISREEFLSILLRVFDVDVKQGNVSFKDVNKNEWYYDTVSTAYNMGIVKGYPDGRFGIGDTILRADMAVMICRMMEIQGKEMNPTLEGFVFKDYADIPDYAYDSVIKLHTAEVLNGDTFGYFNPLNNVTRAESAVAFWSVYKKVSNLVDYVK